MNDPLVSLVEHIARALVDEPDKVDVQTAPSSEPLTIELKVAQDDLGKIIGKKGTTARAIRSVLFAASLKQKRRVLLNVLED